MPKQTSELKPMKKSLFLSSILASALVSGISVGAKAATMITPIQPGNTLNADDKIVTITGVTGSLTDGTVSAMFGGPVGSDRVFNLLFQDPTGFTGPGTVSYTIEVIPSSIQAFNTASIQSTVYGTGNSVSEAISANGTIVSNNGATGGPTSILPRGSKFLTVTDTLVPGPGGSYVSQFTNFYTQYDTSVPEPMTYAGGALALGLGFLVRRKTRLTK